MKRECTVIKVGGARLRDPAHVGRLAAYVGSIVRRGEAVLVVHGGGPEIAELHRNLDVAFTKHRGLRVTSEESMPLVTMVLCGLVNKRVVARFVADGIRAVGLCGVDYGLLTANLLDPEQLGRVGGPPRVDAARLWRVIDDSAVPVLAPVCLGRDGRPVNVNADTVAHAVSTALPATTLDFVSDVPGVRTAEAEVIPSLDAARIQGLLRGAEVSGGMIPKLQAALAAIDAGVERVRVGDLRGMQRGTATEVTA